MRLKNAITTICFWIGLLVVFSVLVGRGIEVFTERVERTNMEECKQDALVIATTTICLKDKDFKCFVTPTDYQEFARAIERRKANTCEAK